MGDMREDRIYADRLGKTDLLVATGMGLAIVSVSNDRIGEFSLAHRCTARDVAGTDDGVVLATDEDVLVGDPEDPEPTGFGPAVAVTVTDGVPVAAGPEGRLARYGDSEWTTLGEVADPRALDGDLLAADGGVYRLPDCDHVGLTDATDVSTAGTPLAATADGCYRLGPGWTQDVAGAFVFVAGDGERAHAGTDDRVYERADGEWAERDHPATDALVDAAYLDDGGVAVLTESGRLLVDPAAAKDGHEGWRSRSLGLPDAVALST